MKPRGEEKGSEEKRREGRGGEECKGEKRRIEEAGGVERKGEKRRGEKRREEEWIFQCGQREGQMMQSHAAVFGTVLPTLRRVLYSTALYHLNIHCTVLYCTALYCTALHYTAIPTLIHVVQRT